MAITNPQNHRPLTYEEYMRMTPEEKDKYLFDSIMPLKDAGYIYFSARRFGIGVLVLIGTITTAGAGAQWLWHFLINHLRILK